MQSQITKLLVLGLIAGSMTVLAVSSTAQEKGKEAGIEEKARKNNPIPFQGKIYAVDKTAMTITLDGKERKRTIHLTPQTRIAKGGKPAALEDAEIGEVVGGQLVKTTDGKEEAVSLRLGPKPGSTAKEKPAQSEPAPDK